MPAATPEEVVLLALMGQALLNIQVLEDALSRSITLKADVGHPGKVSRAEVDELLKKRQALTLGKAIGAASDKKLYDEELLRMLRALLEDRNWFVHKSIDDFYTPIRRDALAIKLKAIAQEAHRLQRRIEDDLIVFSEANGLDMSGVRKALESS
jgi:hypothetical protein